MEKAVIQETCQQAYYHHTCLHRIFKLGVLFNVGWSYRLVRGLGMNKADRILVCSLLQRRRQAGAEEKDIVEATSR